MEEVLKVEHLSKDKLLTDVSFTVSKGEMVAVMGPSGSGKSTLLYQVSGIDSFSQGEVTLCGQELSKLTEDQKAGLRLEKVGFVFQEMQMLKDKSVLDNICLPAIQLHGKKQKKMIEARAKALMQKLSIADLGARDIFSVSGGQLQRACICRSLMNDPDLIFADEPTGALNRRSAQEVLAIFKKLNAEGATILMVTHDSKVAAVCDRIFYLVDGRIEGILGLEKEQGPSQREEVVGLWLAEQGW